MNLGGGELQSDGEGTADVSGGWSPRVIANHLIVLGPREENRGRPPFQAGAPCGLVGAVVNSHPYDMCRATR